MWKNNYGTLHVSCYLFNSILSILYKQVLCEAFNMKILIGFSLTFAVVQLNKFFLGVSYLQCVGCQMGIGQSLS